MAAARFASGSSSLSAAERRALTEMPLHAITSVHGEPALREWLAIEAEGFAATDQERVQRAPALVSRVHVADRRQREPYINHPLRVAIRIVSHNRVADPDLACTGLLHNVVEDHASDLAPHGGHSDAIALFAAQFRDRVAEVVSALTNRLRSRARTPMSGTASTSQPACWRPGQPGLSRSHFVDNGVGLMHATGQRLRRLADKYAPLVPVLRELIVRPDTPLDSDVKGRITAQLDSPARRFAVIGTP